jgi:hypothetical protein
MTSIDELLHDLAIAGREPGYVLPALVQRAAEAAPRLIAAIEDAADGKPLTDADERFVFFGANILGAARRTEAFAPLLRLLHLPGDDLEHLLGDGITELLPLIVAGVFDGNVEALHALVCDPAVDEYARSSVLGALAFLTWEGRVDEEETRRFLERFADDCPAEPGNFVWCGWQEAIALLGWRDLVPRVEAAFKDERIPLEYMEFDDFLEDLARTEIDPEDGKRFADANLGYIDDIVEKLSWVKWTPWTEEEEPDAFDEGLLDQDESWLLDETSPGLPVINPYRDIGRNDPCPCGSGKKYKKCCLAV